MHYRQLGSTGLRVSVIGLGTWQFGGEWGRDFSQSEVDAILDKAAECGINLIDTAECYGAHLSEKFIGNYLSRRDRSQWVLATKFGHAFKGFMEREQLFSAKSVQEQLEASLKALKIESVDVYQFHSGSDAEFENENLWALLRDQQKAGKISHLGISIRGLGSESQARKAREVGAEVLQVIYNRLDRRPEQMYFPHAKRDRLGILARVPLASGLLSGKYRPGAAFPANDFRNTLDREKLSKDLQTVEAHVRAEVPPGVPMAQWALAWCLQNTSVSAVIPGCKDPAQVSANAAAATLLLE